jgi:hypothetical protein
MEDADFWDERREAIAIFSSPTLHVVEHLDRTVPELAVVADSFHIKPLLRILQTLDSFHILALTSEWVKLYKANRDVIKEATMPSSVPTTLSEALGDSLTHKERTIASSGGMHSHGHSTTTDEKEKDLVSFFRAVGKAIASEVSAKEHLPMVLVGLPEQLAVFRSVSHNPWVLEQALETHPDALAAKELRQHVWEVIEPYFTAQSKDVVDKYHQASRDGKGLDHVVAIAKAGAEGRVAVLMVEADRLIPGMLVGTDGEVAFYQTDQPDVDDLLDDLAELVLRKQGDVLVLPAEHMPTVTGCAAVLRW